VIFALDMIRRHHPKLVLLDCWFSNYSRKQISQWIKAYFPCLPVVAFSCDNSIGEQYRQLGLMIILKSHWIWNCFTGSSANICPNVESAAMQTPPLNHIIRREYDVKILQTLPAKNGHSN
jgi:hypothetical protein